VPFGQVASFEFHDLNVDGAGCSAPRLPGPAGMCAAAQGTVNSSIMALTVRSKSVFFTAVC
jgi:hypothetical protein